MRWFIMLLVLALTVSANSTILFQDSFERPDGPVGNDWTNIGPANSSIVGGVMRLESSNGIGVYRDFPAMSTGVVNVQFDWMIEANDWLVDAFPTDIATHIMHDHQGQLYYDLDGLYNTPVQIGALPFNTWATVRMAIDLDNDTFSLWIDDNLLAEDIAGNAVTEFYKWTFKAYPGSTVIQWVDNFFIADGDGTDAMVSPLFSVDTIAPSLDLTAPDGGEIWYIGDSETISWSASDTHFPAGPISLDYSTDNGVNFSQIDTAQANTGAYDWSVPAVQTSQAKVRVLAVDEFGNSSEDVSGNVFTISYVPPDTVDGIVVDVTNGVDAVLSWQPVTQTIYGTPIVPDGYIVLYSEFSAPDNDAFFFHGATADTTYTHHNVCTFRDQMFYRVVAYIDYEGRVSRMLAEIQSQQGRKRREGDSPQPAERISWEECKRLLQTDVAVREGGEK